MGDLFQLTVLPKIVRVTEGWRGSNQEASVENNELLFIKGIKRRINRKHLKAISLKSKEKKELPENCAGLYTAVSWSSTVRVIMFMPSTIVVISLINFRG